MQAEVGHQTAFLRQEKAVRGQEALLIVKPYRLLITAARRHRGDDRHFSSPLSATWRPETHHGVLVFFEFR